MQFGPEGSELESKRTDTKNQGNTNCRYLFRTVAVFFYLFHLKCNYTYEDLIYSEQTNSPAPLFWHSNAVASGGTVLKGYFSVRDF